MDKKLTLLMDEEVIYNAKKYVKKNGTSISNLLENYLKALTMDDTFDKIEYGSIPVQPMVEKMDAIIKSEKIKKSEHYDYKKDLQNILDEKYKKIK